MLKDLVEHVVKEIVGYPEEVQVEESALDAGFLFKIKINDADRGRLIGKDGKTIKAIGALVRAIAPEGKKVIVEIVQ